MKRRPVTQHNEGGFVAIFSVIFFALLAVIITVGFIRITVTEQQQALNNDLTARALAAAEAGVEDAKRAIAYYTSLPGGGEKQAFKDAFDSNNCDALYKNTSVVQNKLDLDPEGRVASDQNLYYTCLTVDLDTPDYVKTVAANESHVIPLRSTGNFNKVSLQWHLVSDAADADGDGVPSNYPLPGELPAVGEFGNGSDQPPAYLRVQLIGAPNGGFNRDELKERSRTVFLVPSDSGGTNDVSLQTDDPRGFNKIKSSPVQVNCLATSQADTGEYACDVDLTLPGGALSASGNQYYLQVTPLYRDTHIRAQVLENDDLRNFDAVQPKITSTGRAADAFRRIEVRAGFPGNNDMLRYAAEVGDNICKQFQVTNNPAHYSDAAAGRCD